MVIKTHVLGYPRIGEQREMKKAVESYWKGKTDATSLKQEGEQVKLSMWNDQQQLDLVCVGDFAWYDHILNASLLLGAVPQRYQRLRPGLEQMFAMARGHRDQQGKIDACEMTKWFNTNYHYLVPELSSGQSFQANTAGLIDEVKAAQNAGHRVKVVLPGPLNFLYLAKMQDQSDKLELLTAVRTAYLQIIQDLARQQVEWVQFDEPWLVADPAPEWQTALVETYHLFRDQGVKVMLATYFGGLAPVADILPELELDALHLDLVDGDEQVEKLLPQLSLPVLSLGVVNGRNIWRSDLSRILARLQQLAPQIRAQELWLGSSCSLLHVPVSLASEQGGSLEPTLQSWLAFAQEKCAELALLKQALQHPEQASKLLAANQEVLTVRKNAASSYDAEVRQRCQSVTPQMQQRHLGYEQRIARQRQRLQLPLLPTTTIGSFPQTDELRQARRKWRRGLLSEQDYQSQLEQEVRKVVAFQEQIGLDVLVHGEPERNDMVEYFGEQLAGYAFSSHGWVQSYGSRCVKPPIIYGDVYRPQPMTVSWSSFAQSLTSKPMKAMLTGPVTMLHWSFSRDDLSQASICQQIALALLDEVLDLEKAGIKVIQIDEPAIREGLPLRQSEWSAYLRWAVDNFRLSHSQVDDDTQIHTHMCYSEFNDIITAIAELDADVITIETSRSHNELFDSFAEHPYPQDIGPGVYDIHSPNIPETGEMVAILELALRYVDAAKLWVNPDCGLKTRRWAEVEPSLTNMVQAARQIRGKILATVSES